MKCFVVTEPKPREIFAADFRDRVVHHLVVTEMEPIWERKFIFSSFACRKGKGGLAALKYLQTKVRQISRGGRSPVWALKLDLARFFVTIHRPTLCFLLERYAPSPELKALIRIIYLHDGRKGASILNSSLRDKLIPPEKSWFSQNPDWGLPIGNLTSQFGANVYLSALDHFVQRDLKPMAYLRYMDDLLLLSRDSAHLQTCATPINKWLQKNRFQLLNPDKTKLLPLEQGIIYLGVKIAQVGTRKEPLRLFPTGKRKWKLIESLKQFAGNAQKPFYFRPHTLSLMLPNSNIRRSLASINSHFGMCVHTKSFGFRRKTLERFERNTLGLLLPSELAPEITMDQWSPVKVKKGYRAICLIK